MYKLKHFCIYVTEALFYVETMSVSRLQLQNFWLFYIVLQVEC